MLNTAEHLMTQVLQRFRLLFFQQESTFLQLSLIHISIGREGQNARLSAKLTGWRIDIKSETQAAETGFLDDEVELPETDENAENINEETELNETTDMPEEE